MVQLPPIPEPSAEQLALILRAAELLESVESVLFVTGAGVSADSGLPTYRGVGGLYQDEDAEEGLPIEVCLSASMFASNPAKTWKYIRQIEESCRGVQPNAAHRRIAELEQRRERVWVLTQNVDGLHTAAGSRNVIAIHGDVHDLYCTRCEWTAVVDDYAELPRPLPRCPKCQAVIRPKVVLFDEMLPAAGLQTLQHELAQGFDAVVIIGTTAMFPYIAAPVVHAKRRGKLTIEINPGESGVSDLVDLRLPMGAALALEHIGRRLLDRGSS